MANVGLTTPGGVGGSADSRGESKSAELRRDQPITVKRVERAVPGESFEVDPARVPFPDGLVTRANRWVAQAIHPAVVSYSKDIAALARTNEGGINPEVMGQVMAALPSIDPVVPLTGDEQLKLLAGAALDRDPATLAFSSPATPGFSGARVIIVSQNGRNVGVVKVSVPEDFVGEISHDKMMRAAGFTAIPDVLGVAKALGPDGKEMAIEVMSLAKGEVIANEAWWANAKANPERVFQMLEKMGERVGQLHTLGPAGKVEKARAEALLCGSMPPAHLDEFIAGKRAEEALPVAPRMKRTGENMSVGILEWVRIMQAAPAVAASGLSFERLEHVVRQLVPSFRENPGKAGWIHGDLHLGQMAVDTSDVTLFDRVLMHANMDHAGRPLFTTAYDVASLLVNVEYFARSARFSDEQIATMVDRFWKGYEASSGERPDATALAFLKLWRQSFVVSLFRDPTAFTPVPGGADFHEVLKDMVFVLNRAIADAEALIQAHSS